MNRVVHFEIQVDNAERAVKFYTDTLGWKFEKWEGGTTPYWMVMTGEKDSKEPGINGGLMPRPAKAPGSECGSNAFVCTVQVENYDEMAKKILAAGGTVAMPKFAIPKMAWQGYFFDTEGNNFGIHQADVNAA